MGVIFNPDLPKTNLRLIDLSSLFNSGLPVVGPRIESVQSDSRACAVTALLYLLGECLRLPFNTGPPTCDGAESGRQGGKFQSLVIAFQTDLQLRQLVEDPELGSHCLHPPRERNSPRLRREAQRTVVSQEALVLTIGAHTPLMGWGMVVTDEN